MRNNLILYIFGLYLALPLAHAQDAVTTSVDLDVKFTQLWRAHHPSKFLKCWGAGDEVTTWQNELKKNYQLNDGSEAQTFLNKEQQFTSFTPQTADWSAKLTDDRVFELAFAQDVSKLSVSQQKNTCTTNDFFSKIDAVDNKFASHASILIPNDIYLIRIHRLRQNLKVDTAHSLKSEIKNAQQIVEDGAVTELQKNQVTVGELDYFFVHPGDRIDFSVNWESQSIEDASFEVAYEIRLLGQDLCRENLWDPNQVKGPAILPFVKSQFTEERMRNSPNEVIAGLACLRSPQFVNDFLKESHGSDLVHFLEALGETLAGLQDQAGNPGTSVGASVPMRELIAVLKMTSYDVSRTLLTDLNAYCQPVTVVKLFTDQPAKPVQIAGYHYAAREYYKIRLLLESAPRDLLHTFGETLDQLGMAKQTYASVYSSQKFSTLEEMQYLIFEKSLRTFTQIRSHLATLPLLLTDASHVQDIQDSLSRGESTLDALNAEFKNILLRFASQKDEIISAAEFDRLVNIYVAQLDETNHLLEHDFDWFAVDPTTGSLAESPFVMDMFTLNSDIFRASGQLLQQIHGKKLGENSPADFIRYQQMVELSDQVNKCLMGVPK